MVASKPTDLMALFHYVDDKGFGGDIEVHADDMDILFAKLSTVQEKAVERGWTGRPADKEKSYSNTYVKVEPKKAATPVASGDAMAAAAQDTFGKRCPIDDTPMGYIVAPIGKLVQKGPFAGKQLPNAWECPRCQKRVWEKPAKQGNTNEIPF